MGAVIGPIPADWQEVPLGDVAEIQAGPSNMKRDLLPPGEHGVPVLTPSEIGWFSLADGAARLVSSEAADRLARYRLRTGDIVCVRTGELGRAAPVGPGHADWVLGTSCLRLRLLPASGVDPGWVLRYLGHPKVRAWIKSHARYSTIPSLSARVLGDLPLAVAPAEVQVAVSGALGALEARIAAHRELIQECERLHYWLLPRLVSGELNVSP
jgi:type I restriction enzyme S subunit